MNKFSRTAAVLLLATATGAIVATPAFAAEKAAAAAPKVKLSKPVMVLLSDAQKLQNAGDLPGALAKANECAALPNLTPDEQYMANAVKINIGIVSKDNKVLEEALRGAMASGKVLAEDQPKFLRNMGALALGHNDYAAATSDFEKLVALSPNDSEAIAGLAELYQRQKQTTKAIAALGKAIDVSKANGQMASESIYRRRLAIAYDAKLAAEIEPASMALVQAYPNSVNWRDSMTIFRDASKLDADANLDALRLMQSAGALNGERDYFEYAESAANKGLPGEAKMVLDDGIAKGMLSPTKPFVRDLAAVVTPKIAADKASLPGAIRDAQKAATGKLPLVTGDALYGYSQFADATAMYKLANSKGGVDADVVNTRLGVAQAKLGDKVAAKAAFEAVKGPGPRASLAKFWLIWLGQQK